MHGKENIVPHESSLQEGEQRIRLSVVKGDFNFIYIVLFVLLQEELEINVIKY